LLLPKKEKAQGLQAGKLIIEESITIFASLDNVWNTFTDFGCWNHWNLLIEKTSPEDEKILREGSKVQFCIYPFNVPIHFESTIEDVSPGKRAVLTTQKWGILSHHEFRFREIDHGVMVTSKESLKAGGPQRLVLLWQKSRLRDLNVSFLKDLKKAAEALNGRKN